jgi:hypothetical protein
MFTLAWIPVESDDVDDTQEDDQGTRPRERFNIISSVTQPNRNYRCVPNQGAYLIKLALLQGSTINILPDNTVQCYIINRGNHWRFTIYISFEDIRMKMITYRTKTGELLPTETTEISWPIRPSTPLPIRPSITFFD